MIFHVNRLFHVSLPINMEYQALFVIFEKADKFEIAVCCKL